MVENLSKHLNVRIGSESQLTRFVDSLNDVDSTILRIGQNMQQVGFGDLDTSKIEKALESLITKQQELTQSLSNSLNTDFTEALDKKLSSGRLKDIFERLKIDPSEINFDNFTQVFDAAIEKNKAKAQELRDAIHELQAAQKQANEAAAEFGQITNIDSSKLVESLRNSIPQTALFGVSKDAVDKIEKGFNQYFSEMHIPEDTLQNKIKPVFEKLSLSENSSQLEHNLRNLSREISDALGKGFFKDEIEKSLSHIMNDSWKNIINFDTFKQIDTSQLDKVRVALEEFFKSTNNLGNDSQIGQIIANIVGVFSNQGAEQAINSATEALKAYIEQAEKARQIKLDEATVAGQQILEKKATLSETNKDTTSLRTNETNLQNQYNDILQKYNEQQQEIAQLRQEIESLRNAPVGNIRQSGSGIASDAEEQLKASALAASEYTQKLNAAKDAEKLVGKVEGIAQRWFSVYAVVRMVTNAIKSMAATIKELDKTITEIAIVTNMSQGDLWGQMGTYTQMAREYAASISGVYQVSQLYYQQGLQTAEVMALTESTLKMARISGLDYAEATDYMTNAVRSFKMEMEDAEKVVDVYSAIAAKSATNVKELAVAMSKTASSAESVGSSFENTTAMMAVMIEATRESATNIGSAMKSIISRYGEMKADPSKLIDSEGEALSLNKVDTALQSVGITLHNAKGEFRDFDDVIEELAKSWDTIDINTQRYIATVMAGNRQQSRFLALVSNYGRYKELSEEAANSENAAQLQFLKTLDSIEAKTQQLQTNIQSLYTSSGLENIYKWILDISNAIISSFSEMPTLFNLPIAAITKFASLFYSLASVVKTVFAMMFNEATIQRIKFNTLQQQEVNDKIKAEQAKLKAVQERKEKEQAVLEELAAKESALNQASVNNKQATEQAKAKAAAEGQLRNTGVDIQLFGKKISTGALGLGLNFSALGLSALGSSLKNSKNTVAQSAGGLASAGSTALSGAALGTSIAPGVGTAIGAIAGSALGLFQNYNTILQDTETRLKTLTEISDESKNKALQEQAEAKALQSSIDKLKELEKARYTSAEAEEKYLEASNTLATQYPELISQYAKTGEAIVDLTNANTLLQKSLQESVSATQKAVKDNYNKAQLERDKELGEQSPINNLNFDSINTPIDRLLDLGHFFGEVDVDKKYSKQYVDAYTGDSEGVLSLIRNSDVQSFVDKYLNGNITENYNELSQELPALLSNESIPELDRYILQAIQKRFELSGLAIQEVAAADYKLDAIGQAGAVQVANSVQLLNKTEEDILNKISNSNEIINSMILNQWGNYKGNYDKYITEIPQLVENAQNTLRDVIGKIGVDAFNEIADYRQGVSAIAFNDYLDTKEFDEEVKEALKNYFKNAYNIEDFRENVKTIDNIEIQQSLLSFSNEAGSKLSSAELQIINDQTKNIINLIDSDKLTQTQGMTFLNQYLSVWSNLENELNNTQKEAAELLLQSWDGSKSGLEGILTSLKNNGVDESNKAYQAISNLIPLVSENLNTLMTNLSTSIATSVKSLDDAVKDLSKGVSIDKAVEYATKLGVDLSKFELDYSTGLWKYNDLNQIQQKYFENIDTQISDAKTMLQQYTDNSVDIKQLIGMSKTQRSGQVGKALYDILGRRGLDKTEVDSIITTFEATGKEVNEFDSWLAEHYEDIFKALYQARENAQARAALSLGNLTGFLSNALKGIIVTGADVEKIITSLIANNGINEADLKDKDIDDTIINALLKYNTLLGDTFKDATQNVYDKAIESIIKGKQEIEVTDTNRSILDSLGITEEIKRDNKTYRKVNWSGMTVGSDQYNKAVDELLLNGVTEEEKSILEALEKALTHNNPGQVLSDITSSWKEVSQTAALLFKSAFDLNDTEFKNIFTFDKFSQTYTTDLQAFRNKIKNNDKLSQKQRNEQLAKIDKELRETSKLSIFEDIGKNYSSISEEAIQKLADNFNYSYDLIAQQFTKNDNGTYSTSLKQLIGLQKALALKANSAAQKIIDSVIDDYINQLANIGDKQTSGFTNLSDMREYADKFSNGNLEIYQWDNDLKAYILNEQGIIDQIAAARQQLASLDKNSNEYKKASKLIEAGSQKLAEQIDFSGLVSSVGSSEYTKNAIKFVQAVNNYNAYLRGLGKTEGLNAHVLLEAAQEGGIEAIAAAKTIAQMTGQQLTGEDIENIYRSKIQKLIDATDQIGLTVGSVIDETAASVLKETEGFKAQSIGQGKYVITSVGKLIDAQINLYNQIKNSNEATTAEINAQYAKLKNLETKSSEIESLGNIAEISYDALGVLLADVNISLESFLDLYSGDLVEELGGGKVKINSFESFATEILKITDTTSKTYIEAFRQYNDQIINGMKSNISDEISNIASASKNDKINITSIYTGLGADLSSQLNTDLNNIGAGLKDGILYLADADIGQVLSIIKGYINQSNITDKDLEIEKIDKQIYTYVDNSIKAAQDAFKNQSSGYSDISEMTEIAESLNGTIDTIFKWDDNLKAYIMTQKGIQQSILKAKHDMELLDKNSTEYKVAAATLEASGKQLADNIDFIGLIESIGTETYIEASQNFNQAILDYNSYLLAAGKDIELNTWKLKLAALTGGFEAAAAAQAIAEVTGKKVSGSDIETIYCSSATKVNNALEQINLSIGSVIDQTTVKLLGIQDKVTDLGSGKAVINSTINVIEAYKKIYEQMNLNNGTTLQEFNSLWAQIKNKEEYTDLLSSFSDLNEMSYDTLAQIADSIGKSTEDLYNSLKNAGALQNLGGGKIRITDIDLFADFTGLMDRSSQEYIKILSDQNDAIIESNRNRANKVLDEIKSVSEAKAGDQINITNLYKGLSKGLQNSLELLIAGTGARLENGILNINDASIPQILGVLQDAVSNFDDIAARDKAEIEDAFEALLNNITEAIKQGLEGKLSNVGKVDLQESLKSAYGIELNDSDFIKTAEGWQLASDAAFEVVDAMQQIDALQGNLVLQELRSSLKEAQFDVRSLYNYTKDLGYKTQSGNVNLVKHAQHQISGQQMIDAGWNDFNPEDYATLYSQTLTSDEFGLDIPMVINATPITNDGETIKSETDLRNYIEGLLKKATSAEEILKLDKEQLGLVLSAKDVESWEKLPEAIKEAEQEMTVLHEQSDKLAGRMKEISEINLMEATSKNDSFDFMNNKLPAAMENPLTYVENWNKAFGIMDESAKSGYMDARNWYNIINEISNLVADGKTVGDSINFFGQKLDGSLESASNAIQNGFNHLKAIDGGKMKVDLSGLGVDFASGAEDMKANITDGIHDLAKGQIEMLDGLISVLETVVAMQEAFAGLKASEDGQLDFGELFTFGEDWEGKKGWIATDDFKKAAQNLLVQAKNSEELKKALEQVKINGDNLSALYDQAAQGYKFTREKADALAAATNALYKASLSGNYDTDNIYESVKEVLQQSGITDGKLTIDIGTTTIYLTGNVITSIDWNSDKTKKAIEDVYKGKKKDGKSPREQAEAAMQEFQKNPQNLLGEGKEADIKFILQASTDVTYDAKKKTYTVDGHSFTDEKEAYRALLLKQTSKNAKLTFDKDENGKEKLSGAVIEGKEGAKVEMTIDSAGNIEYTYIGPTGETSRGDTPQNAIRAYYMAHPKLLPEDMSLDDIVHNESIKLGIESSTGITFNGKDQKGNETEKPTLTQSKMAQELLNNPDIKTYEELRKYSKEHPELGLSIDSSLKGDLSVDDMKKVAEIFGVDYAMEAKQVSLSINMVDTPDPLQNLLKGTETTLEAQLNVTKVNVGGKKSSENSEEGEPTKEGPEETEIEIEGPVTMVASPLTIDTKVPDGNGGIFTAPIKVKGEVDLKADPLNIDTGDAKKGTAKPIKMSGNVEVTPTSVQIINNTNTTVSATIPGFVKAEGKVGLKPSSIVVGSYDQAADISAILNNDEYDTKQQVTALIDLLGLKIKPGEGGEGSEGEGAKTPVEGIPDEVNTDRSVTFKVTSDGVTLNGAGKEGQGAAAILNRQLFDLAQTLITSGTVVDTNAGINLLVGLTKVFTDSTYDLSNIQLPADLIAQLNAAGGENGSLPTEYEIALKIALSSIKAQLGEGMGGSTESGGGNGASGLIKWPPFIEKILSTQKYTPEQKLNLLLAISSATANAVGKGSQIVLNGISGLTDTGTGLSYEDMMNLILTIDNITPQSIAPTPDFTAVTGFTTKEVTIDGITIIIPYETKFVPSNNPLPTGAEFDLDSDLSNLRKGNGNNIDLDTFLAQGDSNEGQLGKLGKYLADIGNYKKQGGIFSEDTNENLAGLNRYFEGLGDNIPDNLKGIAEALKVVNEIQPGEGLEATGTTIDDLSESPALQDTKTAENLTALGQGMLSCCAIDVGHLQQFYHILEDLPGAANTFINDANWAEVVQIFKLLEELKGGAPEGEDTTGVNTSATMNLIINTIWSDELVKKLLSSDTITKTITVTVKKNGDNLEDEGGGDTGGSGNTGGTTTPTPAKSEEADTGGTEELQKELKQADTDAANAAGSIATLTTTMTATVETIVGGAEGVGQIADNVDRTGQAAAGADPLLEALIDAINRIPAKATIDIKANVTLDVDVNITETKAKGTGAKGTPSADVNVKRGPVEQNQSSFDVTKAKGNIALPTGTVSTLMGELGPELVVSDGHYNVVGQNGAEFVDLPKDAIVFNHKKTAQLLKNGHTGRGKPFTNATNAISFAKGSLAGGPAMASAAAALAALKQLRAMWASLLNASAKDLGSQAGRGGGGGKDDDEKFVQPTTTTADIQRWYNWLRQIDKIEKDITYQEKLQKKYETDRIANGEKIYQTQKERLKLLDQEISRNQRLADLQKSWYDRKREELANSSYGKIFTYDENGLQQYVGSGKPGSGLGLDILENLTRRTVEGEATGNAATSKKQLQYLASVGFDINDLIYNDDGTKVVKSINQRTMALKRMPGDEDTDVEELYTKLMENFWARVDGWRDELDSLYDSYQDQLAKVIENQAAQNEILQGFVDNELSIEEKLLEAVEAREQQVIDKLQEQRDALEKSTSKFIKGVQDALDKQKQAQEKNDQQEELTKLQRQLGILQRSGGSATQIKQLQDQIAQKQQDMYYNTRQDEIQAVQDAADKQLEKLDQQIDILTETLEYQKNNGLLWNEVREIMKKPTEFATEFYNQYVVSKSGQSALQQGEDLREFKESFQEWKAYDEDKGKTEAADKEFDEIVNNDTYKGSNESYLKGMTEEEQRVAKATAKEEAERARQDYLDTHQDEREEDREKNANAAMAKAYNTSLAESSISASGNKEDNETFNKNYNQWLENRRIAGGENDFTNSEAFKANSKTFKNAMQAYYLANKDKEDFSWEDAINAGKVALQNDLSEASNQAKAKKAQILDNADEYGKNTKGKWITHKKKAFAKGDSYQFDKAIIAGKDNIKYLHIAGQGYDDDHGWVRASYVSGGNHIFDSLAYSQQADINLKDILNSMSGVENGYYGSSIGNTFFVQDLKKKDLKFAGANLMTKTGEAIQPNEKEGNSINISDISGLKINEKKGTISSAKTVTVTSLNDRQLDQPQKIKMTSNIKSKLNKLLLDKNTQQQQHYLNLLKYMKAYATGGMNYTTGPAWLDGTKTRPEAVLNASQTSFLRNDLLGNQRDSLKSIVLALQDSIGNTASGNSSNDSYNDSINIENIEVTFESGVISSDYDMKRASALFKDELVKIARKSGNRNVTRR